MPAAQQLGLEIDGLTARAAQRAADELEPYSSIWRRGRGGDEQSNVLSAKTA